MKMYWGVDEEIHVVSTSALVRVVRFTPLPLCPWRVSLRYPLHRRLDGPEVSSLANLSFSKRTVP
jgi:hypothetical protein